MRVVVIGGSAHIGSPTSPVSPGGHGHPSRTRPLLGCAPRCEPEAAVPESVRWLIDHAELKPAGPLCA